MRRFEPDYPAGDASQLPGSLIPSMAYLSNKNCLVFMQQSRLFYQLVNLPLPPYLPCSYTIRFSLNLPHPAPLHHLM